MKETQVNSKYIFRGKIVNLRLDEVRLANNNLAKREVIEHVGGVAVLAIQDNIVYLVKQFRYPYLEELLEIPAGKLESGEKPYDTALRELKEEVGIVTDKLISLGRMYPSPGYTNEIIHLYYTSEFNLANSTPDEDEFLEVIKMPLSVVNSLIDKGEIKDAKTIISILMYERKVLKDGK